LTIGLLSVGIFNEEPTHVSGAVLSEIGLVASTLDIGLVTLIDVNGEDSIS
jgi:hypothetical protein